MKSSPVFKVTSVGLLACHPLIWLIGELCNKTRDCAAEATESAQSPAQAVWGPKPDGGGGGGWNKIKPRLPRAGVRLERICSVPGWLGQSSTTVTGQLGEGSSSCVATEGATSRPSG